MAQREPESSMSDPSKSPPCPAFSAPRRGCWFLIIMACLVETSAAQAAGSRKSAAGFLELSDSQMDRVTASEMNASLDLSASAQGASATSSTQGSIQAAQSVALLISLESPVRGVTQAHLLGSLAANVIVASGQAVAKGDSSAQCNAAVQLPSDVVFAMQMNAQTITATSAICSCAAFAIAPAAR